MLTSRHDRNHLTHLIPRTRRTRRTRRTIRIIPIFLVLAPSSSNRAASPTSIAVVFSPQSRKALLLGVRVDVSPDDKGDKVEERHPGFLWKEGLREGKADGRSDPRDAHDGPEAGADGRADLVECAGTGDDGHGDEVDGVLDGGDLREGYCQYVCEVTAGLVVLTMILLVRICAIFAFKLVLPSKNHWSILMRTWPSGAETKAP
jgi:hypothetical protein